jgi:all-trans-retinol 13,14-reductase
MDKHIIIIGSGLGGLSCGYILAKNGYRVTILEKNAQLGGCLQTFTRRGVKFETGMHYIGSVEEGQILYQYFKYLSLLPDLQLRALDKMAYDTMLLNDTQYPYANGRENFIDQLSRFFPKERQNLHRYYDKIDEIVGSLSLYQLQAPKMLSQHNLQYITSSASGFIEEVTDNRILRNVLSGNLPLYGGVYGKTSLLFHALIRDFYNKSAYRIVGGSDAIAASLVKSIRAMGGEVKILSQATKINCDQTKATGVTLNSGEEVRGDYVISSLHPLRTIELLGDTPLIRKSYRERIKSLRNTVSNFTVYIKFKKGTVPYLNTNVYYLNCENAWEIENYTSADYPRGFLYMHNSCSSADNPTADAAVLIAYMRFEEVSCWQGTQVGRRGSAYEEFKRCKAERLLGELEGQFPGTLKNIEAYYTSTPLTYLDYTGTEQGSMYGILRDCTEALQSTVSQRTKIPNLYYTGQNINMHGILGVIIGSIITSSELLGINSIVEQIKNG